MCFSPTASFTAAIVLTVTGTTALTRSGNAPERLLSAIPVLFAVQQFTEGIVWLSLLHPEFRQWKGAAVFAFLAAAQVLWPVYIPLVTWQYEPRGARKRQIAWCAMAGSVLAALSLACLIIYPASAVAANRHIRYEFAYALPGSWYYGLLYAMPTVAAPLLSSYKPLRWLGAFFLFSYLLSRAAFHLFVVSVWCFFGALISLYIVLIVLGSHATKRA